MFSKIPGCSSRRCSLPATSAAAPPPAHWDLTEQIFKDIVVLTARTVRAASQERHGAEFTLKHIAKEKIFGTKSVWRGRSKIAVSDIHRTIIDMLDDPPLGGGIQHVADCCHRLSAAPDRDDAKLIEYGERLGNGAVFKRLGFLAARMPGGERLAAACRRTSYHRLRQTRSRARVPAADIALAAVGPRDLDDGRRAHD